MSYTSMKREFSEQIVKVEKQSDSSPNKIKEYCEIPPSKFYNIKFIKKEKL